MKVKKYIEGSLVFGVIKCAEELRRDLNIRLRNEAVNYHEALILVMMYTESERELTPGDLGAAINISKALVSQSLTKLEENKLLKRRVDEEDARRTYLKLNRRGELKAIALMKSLDQMDKETEKRVSKRDLGLVLDSLKKLI